MFDIIIFQIFDQVAPKNEHITLSDLKRCRLADRFFNMFTNHRKYLYQESAEGDRFDPIFRDRTEWEVFCEFEYDRLVEDTPDY